MDKIKNFFLGLFVFSINLVLVLVGVFLIKNQHEKEIAEKKSLADLEFKNNKDLIDDKIEELQKIIEKNKNAKIEDISKNTGSVSVEKPTTVTETIPAVTKTVEVPVQNTKPNKTTKKS